jgi:hypothetical protein
MERAGLWLTEQASKLTCPGCGGRDWSIEEHIFLLMSPPDPPGKEVVIARAMNQGPPPQPIFSPCVVVICRSCKLLQLFGAGAMGLFDPVAPPSGEKPE